MNPPVQHNTTRVVLFMPFPDSSSKHPKRPYCHFVTCHFCHFWGRWASLGGSLCHRLLLPAVLIHLLHPAVASPAGEDLDEGVAGHVAAFQGGEVVQREHGRELVEDGVVG